MSNLADFFAIHGRISRRALARFAQVDVTDVDRAAQDLGFGSLLRLDEAEEILDALDDEDDGHGAGESSEDDEEDE